MSRGLIGVFFLALLAGSVAWGYYSYRECRRIHPIWYCLSNG